MNTRDRLELYGKNLKKVIKLGFIAPTIKDVNGKVFTINYSAPLLWTGYATLLSTVIVPLVVAGVKTFQDINTQKDLAEEELKKLREDCGQDADLLHSLVLKLLNEGANTTVCQTENAQNLISQLQRISAELDKACENVKHEAEYAVKTKAVNLQQVPAPSINAGMRGNIHELFNYQLTAHESKQIKKSLKGPIQALKREARSKQEKILMNYLNFPPPKERKFQHYLFVSADACKELASSTDSSSVSLEKKH